MAVVRDFIVDDVSEDDNRGLYGAAKDAAAAHARAISAARARAATTPSLAARARSAASPSGGDGRRWNYGGGLLLPRRGRGHALLHLRRR